MKAITLPPQKRLEEIQQTRPTLHDIVMVSPIIETGTTPLLRNTVIAHEQL